MQQLGPPFPQLPPMRQLGERSDAIKRTRLAGQVLSQGLAMLGLHQYYVPVLDVDTNPDNPAIVGAVETGALPRARLLQAAARIRRMKQRYQPLLARLEALFQAWREGWAVG